MTTMNAMAPDERPTIKLLRRCGSNVAAAVKILIRPARFHPVAAWPMGPRQLAIAGGAALAMFLFGMFFIDAPVERGVQHLPRLVVDFFDGITDYGKSGWFLWPLGLLFLGLATLPRMLTRMSQRVLAAVMVRVGFLFLAIGAPSLFATIIKRMIGRARPGVGGSIDPTLFSPFKWSAAYAALPSGHTTTAFAVLVAFGSLWPRWRTVVLVYALLIAASRMIVTAHYPTDVATGALVGIVGAVMVRRYFALRGLGFAVREDDTLCAFPGPSLKRIKAVARTLLAE
jgi:membrane-associated phospholipid phosphatase